MARREPEMVPAKAIVYSHKVGSVTEQRCLYVVPDDVDGAAKLVKARIEQAKKAGRKGVKAIPSSVQR